MATSSSLRSSASRIAARDRLRVLDIGADGRVAARLVERLVRRRRHGHAGRHRLEHGDPEALEARRIDEDGGAAVEARKLVVVDVAEPDDAGPVEARLRPPTRRADDCERELSVEQLVRGEQRLEVLPRLERRNREGVRPPELGALALAREDGRRGGMCDAHALRLDVQQLAHVARRELRVADEDVSRFCRVPVLRAVHAHRAPVRPFGKTQRNEIVDRRRAHAGPLRREHPVREVQHVEAAEPALGRGMPDPRPRGAPAVRERQHEQPALDVDARERPLDVAATLHGDGREGDDVGAVLAQAPQRREHVVADSRARVRERRDVERDPHRCVYANVRKRMPSRRAAGHLRRRDHEPGRAVPKRNGQAGAHAGEDDTRHAVRAHRLRAVEQARIAEQVDAHRAAGALAAAIDDDSSRPVVVGVEAGDVRHRTNRSHHGPHADARFAVGRTARAAQVERPVAEQQPLRRLGPQDPDLANVDRRRPEVARHRPADVVHGPDAAVEELVLPDDVRVGPARPQDAHGVVAANRTVDPVQPASDAGGARVVRGELGPRLHRLLHDARSTRARAAAARAPTAAARRGTTSLRRARTASRRAARRAAQVRARSPSTTARGRACPM